MVAFVALLWYVNAKREFFNKFFKWTLDSNFKEDSKKLHRQIKQLDLKKIKDLNSVNDLDLNSYKDGFVNFSSSFVNQILKYRFYAILGGIMATALVMIQALLLFSQNNKIDRQNDLIKKQNEKIEKQVYLEEASRRNNLVLLMDNILEKVNDEIVDGNGTLSKPLIGRISALSQGFQPYYFLEDDSLTKKPYSPERGQLLLALANSGINAATLDIIYAKATFKQAYLKGAQMDSLYLKKVNLAEAHLSEAFLRSADLEGAKLWEADLKIAHLDQWSNLSGANLSGADCRNTVFNSSILNGTSLGNADLRNAQLNNTDLSETDLRKTKLLNASLSGACLDKKKVKSENWIDNLKIWNVSGYNQIKEKYDIVGNSGLRHINKQQLYYILNFKGDYVECKVQPGIKVIKTD